MTCYWVASDQPRMVRGRHADDCPGEECRGCQPCTESHCRVCAHDHAEHTCPACMAETRDTLAEIRRMCAALPAEVIHRGVESEAMNLLGPAADPEQTGHVAASVSVGRLPVDWLEAADNDLHPLIVLGTWAEAYIEAFEHDEPARITVDGAASYLDRNLTYASAEPDIPFEDFARDLRSCRVHIERVLHDGEQVDLGAPCLKCGRRVEKLTHDDGKITYRCETCRKDVSEAGYMLAVKAEYIDRADMLTYNEMAIRTGVKPATLRTWANERAVRGEVYPPLFRSCGRNGQGHKMFRVIDVERVRDNGGDTRGSTSSAVEGATVSNEGAA